MSSRSQSQISGTYDGRSPNDVQEIRSPATLNFSSNLQDLRDLTGLVTSNIFHPFTVIQIYFPNMWPFSGATFKPETDIGDLSGKVILVTGGRIDVRGLLRSSL